MRLGLAGWVRNCRDGSVEAEFEGNRQELVEMREWCHSGPSFAMVTHLDERWESGPARYEGFHVKG